MGIESFAEDVKKNVIKRLGKGCNVTVHRVDKNNGVVYTGLCVRENDESVSPVVYIDSHYDRYKNGEATLADTADYVAGMCRKKRPVVDMRQFLDYANVKSSIIYKLINTDKNRELLGDVPHLEFLDLSIVFQFLVKDEKIGTATVLIRNAHAKLWGVSAKDLYEAASRNTPKLRGYEMKSMKQVISEIMQEENIQEEGIEDLPLYVLTNKDRIEGAACILYEHLLKDFSDALGGNFYIIPSSTHETLLMPADNMDDSSELKAMIGEINDTQVLDEEILSYSLYYYDRDKDEVRVCEP